MTIKKKEKSRNLERLESRGFLTLPEKKSRGPKKGQRRITTGEEPPGIKLTGSVESFAPVEVQRVQSP